MINICPWRRFRDQNLSEPANRTSQPSQRIDSHKIYSETEGHSQNANARLYTLKKHLGNQCSYPKSQRNSAMFKPDCPEFLTHIPQFLFHMAIEIIKQFITNCPKEIPENSHEIRCSSGRKAGPPGFWPGPASRTLLEDALPHDPSEPRRVFFGPFHG